MTVVVVVLLLLPCLLVYLASWKKDKIKETKVVQKNLNPHWDETFTLDFSTNPNQETLVVEVWDHDHITKHDPLGEVNVALPFLQLNKGEWKDVWFPLVKADKGEVHLAFYSTTFGYEAAAESAEKKPETPTK